jgi:hypothetical protein
MSSPWLRPGGTGHAQNASITVSSGLPLLNTEPLSSGAHQDPAMMAQWSKQVRKAHPAKVP